MDTADRQGVQERDTWSGAADPQAAAEPRFALSVRGVVFSALFAALTVVLDFLQIHLGFTPVPITLGNLGVMLAGALLGPWYGFFSMFLLVALTAFGLPLLDGVGGLGILLGPKGGYVWTWPFCALFTGLFVSRIPLGRSAWTALGTFVSVEVFGSLLNYVGGVPWLIHVTHLSIPAALAAGCWPFLPGDAAKAVITTLVVLLVRPVYPLERLVGKGGPKVVSL